MTCMSYKQQIATTTEALIEPPKKSSYKALVLVLGYVLIGSSIGMYLADSWSFGFGMRMFMGLFFLAFSFFKLLDLKGFAYSYISYDLIGSKWIVWGFIYPFIELGLGALYMFNLLPSFTNILTAVLMMIGLAGALKVVFKKSKIKCACLGTEYNLPMSFVVVENGSMLLMAVHMIVMS